MSYKSFDFLYNEICEKIRESNSTEVVLDSLTCSDTDFHRIKKLLELLPSIRIEIVSSFAENVREHFSPKSEEKAKKLLRLGCHQKSLPLLNQAIRHALLPQDSSTPLFDISDFRRKENLEAIKTVATKTPTSAPAQSVLAEIYASRSEILFQNGNYIPAIRDCYRSLSTGFGYHKPRVLLRIALSFKELGYMVEAKEGLHHALQALRLSELPNETKCKEAGKVVAALKEIQQLGQQKEEIEKSKSESLRLELFQGEHEKLVGASKALSLMHSEERGRHIIAKGTIPPGSILIIEEPFAWSLSPENYPTHCQHCLNPEVSTSDGIPCSTCSSVIFCDEICREKCNTLFHKFECRILGHLVDSEKLGRMATLCYRTVARVPLEQLLTMHETFIRGSSKDTLKSEGLLIDSSHYSSVFSQTPNSKLRNGADLLKRGIASIYLTLCLRLSGYFPPHLTGDENRLSKSEVVVASVFLRHLQSVSCNAYGISQVEISSAACGKSLKMDEVGGGSYPLISTTNHSCNPNIYRFNVGKKCVVGSLREIQGGEEVLDSYGATFTTAPAHQRILELKTQYLFQCSCEACMEAWPCFSTLRGSGGNDANKSPQKEIKCPNCKTFTITVKFRGKCPHCGRHVEFKKIEKHFKSVEELYKEAKERLLLLRLDANANNAEHTRTLHSICKYVAAAQTYLSAPSKELIEAQEILKLFWNVSVLHGTLIV